MGLWKGFVCDFSQGFISGLAIISLFGACVGAPCFLKLQLMFSPADVASARPGLLQPRGRRLAQLQTNIVALIIACTILGGSLL